MIVDTKTRTSGKRERTLVNWQIISDEFGALYAWGQVIEDTEPDFSPGVLRLTTTSPIQGFDGFSLRTQSGSVYKLQGEPTEKHKEFCTKIGYSYTGKHPAPWILTYD